MSYPWLQIYVWSWKFQPTFCWACRHPSYYRNVFNTLKVFDKFQKCLILCYVNGKFWTLSADMVARQFLWFCYIELIVFADRQETSLKLSASDHIEVTHGYTFNRIYTEATVHQFSITASQRKYSICITNYQKQFQQTNIPHSCQFHLKFGALLFYTRKINHWSDTWYWWKWFSATANCLINGKSIYIPT